MPQVSHECITHNQKCMKAVHLIILCCSIQPNHFYSDDFELFLLIFDGA